MKFALILFALLVTGCTCKLVEEERMVEEDRESYEIESYTVDPVFCQCDQTC
ncbi:MAG: hypothetical protein ACQESG_03455 [Nanobdellota archaeon]